MDFANHAHQIMNLPMEFVLLKTALIGKMKPALSAKLDSIFLKENVRLVLATSSAKDDLCDIVYFYVVISSIKFKTDHSANGGDPKS